VSQPTTAHRYEITVQCDGQHALKRFRVYTGADQRDCKRQAIADGWKLMKDGRALCADCKGTGK
jgi:hypothetical protein